MDKNIIKLQGRFDSSRKSIIELIKTLNTQISNLGNLSMLDELIIDLSDIAYIDSNISVILYAYIKEIDNNNKVLIKIKGPIEEKVQEVLLKNNFCSLWNEQFSKDYKFTYIKIKSCKDIYDCINYTQNELSPHLTNLQMNNALQNELFESLFELNTNAYRHGKCDSLYICGQFFPNNHRLNLTYVNFGKTFRQNYIGYLKTNKIEESEKNSITWAKRDGNSTESDSAGVGLATFFDVLKKYNSNVIIFSGNEILEYNENIEMDDYIDTQFKGCIINIKFNLNEKNSIK